MDGHDRQWRLNRHNFEGHWSGTSHWYLRGAGPDGLVCSVPAQLPHGAFPLQVGCLLSPQLLTQVSMLFDGEQQLCRWELRRFRPWL